MSSEGVTFALGRWKIPVVYEDDHLLVLNKPGGLAVHGGAEVSVSVLRVLEGHTRSYYPVHRLDKETSGLLLLAKDSQTASEFGRRMASIEKTYLAIVKGRFIKQHGLMTTPITVDSKIKEAKTHFKVLRTFSKYSLLKVTLHTGRKHQIRIHLSSFSHPICGDKKYGDFAINRQINRHHTGGLYLCCYALRLPFYRRADSKRRSLHLRLEEMPQSFRDFLKAHGADKRTLSF